MALLSVTLDYYCSYIMYLVMVEHFLCEAVIIYLSQTNYRLLLFFLKVT